MVKAHYLIKTVSRFFEMGSRCSWNNIFQINTLSQEQKYHSLIFLYATIKNVLVFFKNIPQRRSHSSLKKDPVKVYHYINQYSTFIPSEDATKTPVPLCFQRIQKWNITLKLVQKNLK